MTELPDAPWIVEAETDGMPEAEPFICPECGAEDPERVYTIRGRQGRQSIVGCSDCIDDWMYTHGRTGTHDRSKRAA